MANCFGYFGYYIKGCLSATSFFSLLYLVQSLTCSTAVFLYLFIDKNIKYILTYKKKLDPHGLMLCCRLISFVPKVPVFIDPLS